MNLKGLTAPLADKINELVFVLTDLLDTVKRQEVIQQNILNKLDDLDESVNKKNICEHPKDSN